MYALFISFRTDNLNCFRASSLWRSRWQRCPNPGRPKLTTPDKRRFSYGAQPYICPTINTLAILRYLCGSEMVLLGAVIGKCEIPTTNISQENGHGMLMIEFQFVS